MVIRLAKITTDANRIPQTPTLEETNCTGSRRIYLDQVMDTKEPQPINHVANEPWYNEWNLIRSVTTQDELRLVERHHNQTCSLIDKP